MRRYRSYMDRNQVTSGAHKRLMDRLEVSGRTNRYHRNQVYNLSWVAGIALSVLTFVLLIFPAWADTSLPPDPTAGVAKPPAEVPVPEPSWSPLPDRGDPPAVIPEGPGAETEGPAVELISEESVDPAAEASETPLPDPPEPPEPSTLPTPPPMGEPDGSAAEATVVVEDPFNGQPHSNFLMPALDIPDYTGRTVGAYIRSLPEGGCFTEQMSADEIIGVLGGTGAVPWTLEWTGYGLWGTAAYDGEGRLWEVEITGQLNTREHFVLHLVPGSLPFDGSLDAPTFDYNGTEISAYYLRSGRNGGEYSYYTYFMAGDVGIFFLCGSASQDSAAWLTSALVREYTSFRTPTLDHLEPERIPAWRDESLTLEGARAEALGAYLPVAVPERYAFQWARVQESEADGDTLMARWEAGDEVLQVSVIRFPPQVSRPAADFKLEEVTPQAMEALAAQAAGLNPGADGGNAAPGYSFTVDHGEVYVYYLLSGLTGEEAADLAGGGG